MRLSFFKSYMYMIWRRVMILTTGDGIDCCFSTGFSFCLLSTQRFLQRGAIWIKILEYRMKAFGSPSYYWVWTPAESNTPMQTIERDFCIVKVHSTIGMYSVRTTAVNVRSSLIYTNSSHLATILDLGLIFTSELLLVGSTLLSLNLCSNIVQKLKHLFHRHVDCVPEPVSVDKHGTNKSLIQGS